VRRVRPAPAGARCATVCALRGADGARAAGLPRLQPAALVHDGALGAVAGGPCARARRALEAGRDLAGATGRRAGGPRAAAASRRGDRRRAGGAGPTPAARRRPAGGARGRARSLVGSTCRAPRAPDARRTPAARAGRRCPPPQRAWRLRGAGGAAGAGPRGRRLHDGRDRRRMRAGAAPGGRRAGARGDARAHPARSDLCSRAARWQTPSTEVPERGGTRCNFR
jgi:hypothetical protein